MRVLGLDPGLRHLGWGIIDVDGARVRHVANGICHTATGSDLAWRLNSLFDQLSAVVATYAPDTAAVEQTFVNKDAVATLKLGQARGIALLVPARAGLMIGEYAPNKVKKTVVGVGHAGKEQVEHMVRVHLPGIEIAGPDAADALAVAICHANHIPASQHAEIRARSIGLSETPRAATGDTPAAAPRQNGQAQSGRAKTTWADIAAARAVKPSARTTFKTGTSS